ncbi:MAG TPA: DUF721 domain-containing protein [Arenicellales bacterium]|nr:DUF721 domain-containing protein [Arenicellales bacterium]
MSRAGRTNYSFASIAQALRQSRNPVLAEAVDRYRELTPLNTAWNGAVSGPLCRHARPVALRDGVLTVHAESPVWANLLRNSEQSVVSALRDSGLSEVRSLRIRIAPPKPAQDKPPTDDQEADNPKFRRLFAQLRRALD